MSTGLEVHTTVIEVKMKYHQYLKMTIMQKNDNGIYHCFK